jgi:hypothetical protein
MTRPKLTYANVTASLALFLALGGTSYAVVSLPNNSVGQRQIRTGAVRSSDVKDGSLDEDDLSRQARKELKGARGPVGAPGPSGAPAATTVRYFATVRSSGGAVRGNSTSSRGLGSGKYNIGFAQPVTNCAFTATIGSTDATPPPTGRIVVFEENGTVAVRTYDDNGKPTDLPFHLIVAC